MPPDSFWYWVLVLGVLGGGGYAVVTFARAMRVSAPEAGPTGIGGWLVILLLAELCSLLGGMAGIAGSLDGQAGSVAAAIDYMDLGLALAWSGLAVAIVIAMFRRSWLFTRLWKIQGGLFVIGALLTVGGYALAPTGNPIDQASVVGMVAGVVLVALGWWYLTVSRRVRNTFAGTSVPAVQTSERLLRWFAVGFAFDSLAAARSLAAGSSAFVDAVVQCTIIGLVFAGVAGAVIRLRRRLAT